MELEIQKLNFMAQSFKMSNDEVLQNVILTYIAKRMPPTLKGYNLTVGSVTPGSVSSMEKGRTGKRPITKNLKILFDTYEDQIIESELFKYSCLLVENTLNGIFEGDCSPATEKKYLNAINDLNLIYLMLQVAVRLISFELDNRGMNDNHKTLKLVTDAIKSDKKKISKMFREAYKNGTLEEAKTTYFNMLAEYLKDFSQNRYNMSVEFATLLGKEQVMLEMFGEENVLDYLNYYCDKIKDNVQENMGLQIGLYIENISK